MPSLRALDSAQTLANLETAIVQRNHGDYIDSSLYLHKKWSFEWVVYQILSPFIRFYGINPLTRFKVEQVARSIISLFESDHSLKQRPEIRKMVAERILRPLFRGSKRNQALLEEFQEIFQPALSIDFETARGALQNFGEEEAKGTFTLSQLEEHREQLESGAQSLRFTKSGPKGNRTRRVEIFRSQWVGESERVFSSDIPLSLHIDRDRIYLLFKKIVGKGGQTTVRSCLDLKTGRLCIRKKICNQIQRFAIDHFFAHPTQGITPALAIREIEGKSQVIEPLRKGNLTEWLENEELNRDQKKIVMEDLLRGLNALHQIEHRGIPVERINYVDFFGRVLYHNDTSSGPFFLSHQDIKPENILVHRSGGTIRAEITDLGGVNPTSLTRTLGYASPTKLREFGDLRSDVRFYQEEGRAEDIWSLGLVFLAILAKQKYVLSPLPLLERRLNEALSLPFSRLQDPKQVRYSREKEVLHSLRQDEIEESIDTLKRKCECDQEESPLWDLTKAMLQIDPRRRPTAAECLEQITALQ